MKNFFMCTMLLFGVFISRAQDQNEFNVEGHYLSLQVNELARQLFSFGNTAIPSNPYFFNYTYTNPDGKGLNIGFAYTLDKIDNSDNLNDVTTDISNFAFRVGYDKKNQIGRNFIYGIGVDLVIDAQKNKTINSDSFSSQEITTIDKTSGWGLGPRMTFHYRINDFIWIGTEANYYFKSLKNTFEIEFDNNPSNNDEEENKINRFSFSAPAILWLSIRL